MNNLTNILYAARLFKKIQPELVEELHKKLPANETIAITATVINYYTGKLFTKIEFTDLMAEILTDVCSKTSVDMGKIKYVPFINLQSFLLLAPAQFVNFVLGNEHIDSAQLNIVPEEYKQCII